MTIVRNGLCPKIFPVSKKKGGHIPVSLNSSGSYSGELPQVASYGFDPRGLRGFNRREPIGRRWQIAGEHVKLHLRLCARWPHGNVIAFRLKIENHQVAVWPIERCGLAANDSHRVAEIVAHTSEFH